jgi:hypothetical protein
MNPIPKLAYQYRGIENEQALIDCLKSKAEKLKQDKFIPFLSFKDCRVIGSISIIEAAEETTSLELLELLSRYEYSLCREYVIKNKIITSDILSKMLIRESDSYFKEKILKHPKTPKIYKVMI